MEFWPTDDEHMCSKHVEAWNKLIVKYKFCASSWLITEINILSCTVRRTSKFSVKHIYFTCQYSWHSHVQAISHLQAKSNSKQYTTYKKVYCQLESGFIQFNFTPDYYFSIHRPSYTPVVNVTNKHSLNHKFHEQPSDLTALVKS